MTTPTVFIVAAYSFSSGNGWCSNLASFSTHDQAVDFIKQHKLMVRQTIIAMDRVAKEWKLWDAQNPPPPPPPPLVLPQFSKKEIEEKGGQKQVDQILDQLKKAHQVAVDAHKTALTERIKNWYPHYVMAMNWNGVKTVSKEHFTTANLQSSASYRFKECQYRIDEISYYQN